MIRTWAQLMPQFVFAINDSPSAALKEQRTPLYVEYGFHPRRPMDFLDGVPREEREEDVPARLAKLAD